MAYSYPSPRTGTSQDLFRIVTRAYERQIEREGIVLPVKGEPGRRFVEPFARALGIGVSWLLEVLPGDWVVAFHDKLFRSLSKPHWYEFDAGERVVRDAAALAARLESESGRAPALLALISHPPVLGDLAHLNFELVRRATLLLRAVRGRACRPRLVAAVDPFALDATSIVEEGLYAGFMGTFHLGIDRLALGRGHPGPWMSPQTRWDRMPLRLLRLLAEGREAGMVQSGGVPATGRVLYGVRDWTRRARSRSPLRGLAADALKSLRADASFARFEKAVAAVVDLPGAPRRLVDAWLMAAAAGLLSDETAAQAASAILACWQVPAAERPALLEDLARDLARETPSRRRLYRLLAGRVARRRPLVLLPIVHETAPPGVFDRAAWGVVWSAPGRVRVVRPGLPDASMTPDELAEAFTSENFK